jgi:tight adherence protein B
MAVGITVFVLVLLVWAAPQLIERIQKRTRLSRLTKALDAELDSVLAILARQLRAGHDLGRALSEAEASYDGMVLEELKHWSRERKVTLSLGQVLMQRGERLGMEPLKIAGATLLVRDKLGGPLAATLEELARSLRDTRSLRMKIEAASATHRMQASMLSILIPLLSAGAIALSPGATEAVFFSTAGQVLLGLCGCLLLIGHCWVRSLCRVD